MTEARLDTAIASARLACEAYRSPALADPYTGGGWLVLDANGLRLELSVKPGTSAEEVWLELAERMREVGR